MALHKEKTRLRGCVENNTETGSNCENNLSFATSNNSTETFEQLHFPL